MFIRHRLKSTKQCIDSFSLRMVFLDLVGLHNEHWILSIFHSFFFLIFSLNCHRHSIYRLEWWILFFLVRFPFCFFPFHAFYNSNILCTNCGEYNPVCGRQFEINVLAIFFASYQMKFTYFKKTESNILPT